MAKLPSFKMLSHLKLGLVSGEVLLGLLHKSPILKTLHFKVGNSLQIHLAFAIVLNILFLFGFRFNL